MTKTDLPTGWIADKLSNVVEPRGEKVSPSDFPHYQFIGMDHVESQTTRIIGSVPASEMKSSAARFFTGDVLYGRLRPYLNKVTIPTFDGLASAEFMVFPNTELIRNSFLKYRLNAADFVSFASHLNEGDRPRVSFDQISDFEIMVPPPAEQDRIVSKIEHLFSELDNGIQSLMTARDQLKAYRQAVLKQAFEGNLTALWRKQNPAKLETTDQLLARIEKTRELHNKSHLKEAKAASRKQFAIRGSTGKPPAAKRSIPFTGACERLTRQLPKLPAGWHCVPIQWLLTQYKKGMTTGPFGTMLKKDEHRPTGVPVLGIENIGEATFLDGNKIFVTAEKANELEAFSVQPGDIIISRSGTVGEICEVPKGFGKALISTNLLRVSLNPEVIRSQFFVFLFQGCVAVKNQVKELCKGSSRDFLNQSILSAIAFPLPSLNEQDEILRRIQMEMSRVENLMTELETNLAKADSLRLSIFKKAFSGKLVVQDSKDESASVLLERIKAEKANKENGNKKNGRRKAA